MNLSHRLGWCRFLRLASLLSFGGGCANGIARSSGGGRGARQRASRETDGRFWHAVFLGQLLDVTSLDCDLLQARERVGAFLGCDFLQRLRALAVLVHVRGGLAANVNRELRRETPFALRRAAQSLHHRFAREQRRRRNLSARDAVEDDGVFDRVENLVGEHALLARENTVCGSELRAHAWAFVILSAEKHALGHADAKSDLVHKMLHESGERLRRTRRHNLDAVAVLEITNHANLGQLVLLLLSAWQRERRVWLEKIARVGDASVVEDKRGLLRRETDARFLGLENVVKHPHGLNRRVEIGDTPHLVDPKRIEVVAELIRWNVLCAKVNAVPVYAINAVCDGLTEVVGDDALVIVVRLDRCAVRIADARGRHELKFQAFARATNHKAAITIHRTLLGGELHELLERVPIGYVAVLAPLVEVIADRLIVITISGRRRVFVRREIKTKLARNLARFWAVLDEVARLPHHDDAVALILRALGGLAVLLRRVKTIGARGVILEKRFLHASFQTLQCPLRRNVFERAVEPRLIFN